MEPVLLVCGSCGVRIRTRHPEIARTSGCPRCDSPLASAVDLALGIELAQDDLKLANTPAPARRLTTAALAILVTVGSLASLVGREASPGSEPPASPTGGRPSKVLPVVKKAAPSAESLTTPASSIQADESDTDEIPKLFGPPGPPTRDLAILDHSRRDPVLPPPTREAGPRTGSLDRSPPLPPQPDGSLESTPKPQGRSTELQRLVVRDSRGRSIVAREFGILRDRLAAILPDGQIGWPEGLVATQEPFVPLTMDQMKRELLEDPEFTAFRFHQTAHYLVVYQCGEPFARASAELLEKLHDGLTSTLKKNGLPIVPMEFPLVAVIFATEDDFRANRPVAPDVQAYYEPSSNRIFFYEKSRRDQDSPEVSALRKPQTVAHEGTHQILNNVGIQPRLSDWPIWLIEGLAEYCSSPRFTKKGAEWAGIGQPNPIHLATIRDLDDPLPNQFRGDRHEADFQRDRGMPLVEYLVTRTQKDLTPTDYARSWALTHYLVVQRLDDFVAYIKRMSQLRPYEEQLPADQLAAFREAFGNDLAQMDGKVAKHLKKFKQFDALPHFAVIFEQAVGPTAVRRHYMVSQSPSVIRQWLESVTAPEGEQPHWRAFPHLTQKKALEAAEQWMMGGR
jgi:Protein of unknown function (DUF1570)